MCQVHTGAYVSLLAPGKTDYTACHPRKITTYEYILRVLIVSITTHTHDRRKSIGEKKQRKEKKVKERKEKKKAKKKNQREKGRKEKTRKSRQDVKRKQGKKSVGSPGHDMLSEPTFAREGSTAASQNTEPMLI